MRLATILMSVSIALASATPASAQESCAVCHGPEKLAVHDSVHAEAGVRCIDCHGAGAAWDDAAGGHGEGLRRLTDAKESVESCASCHSDIERMRGYGLRTDQASLYWTSFHGRKLLADGDQNVATCVSCHDAHRVLRATDPRATTHKLRQVETCGACHGDAERMEPYGLDTDVVDEFLGSVHGRSLLQGNHLANPSCADCHGSHGATPPRIEEVGRVCGNCHTMVRRAFEESPHLAAAQAGRMQECISCHGSHGVEHPSAEMLVGDEEGHCGACHDAGVGTAMDVAGRMHATLAAMDARVYNADEKLREAATRGLFVGSLLESLDDARGLRVRARPLMHALSPEVLVDLKERADGMVDQTIKDGLGQKERGLRDRKIYTSLFFGVVLLFAGGLIAYRREAFDRAQPRPEDVRGGDGA